MRFQTLIVETEQITPNPLLRSLWKFNMSYTFIGQDFEGKWSFREKTKMLYDNISEDKIVMVLDYRDTMLLGGEDEILKIFYSFNKPIVFGRDMLCYPDASLAKYFETEDYLNAGVFIGYGKDVKWLLETALTKYDDTDDQLMFTKIYIDNKNKIAIDKKCEFVYNCQLWASETPETTIFDVRYDYKNKRIVHRKYGTIPKIYHSPGSKMLIKQALKLL